MAIRPGRYLAPRQRSWAFPPPCHTSGWHLGPPGQRQLATLAAGKVLMPSMTLLCDDVQLQLDAAESVGRVRWGWAASAVTLPRRHHR